MAIVRFNPFNDFVSLQREMNRLFDTVAPSRFKDTNEDRDSAVWRPVVDVHEDENNYLIDVELAGMGKDDVKLNFQDGTLSIAGERKYEHEKNDENGSNGKNSHRIERFYGKFYRSFTFPTTVNSDGISATFDNGILKVSVPKAEEVKPRQISIS